MKENFGFIERADVVKEIFFHFSEAKSMKEELRLGDDVEFIIQTRNVYIVFKILYKYRFTGINLIIVNISRGKK